MFVFVTTMILYVFGFVFLYGVVRLGVRHGMQDVEAHRAEVLQAEQFAAEQDRRFARDNAFLTGR
ncbi:hypothetical protein GA0070624_0902 [Micromonospora rhizosphaerae]|uniref:Uncharacterized protein n=1 Tax=Micromonospora rhizosphaerae TaxID=568872 RepID=A0A1C6RFR5_9ACTN|nr:hypothetical protein [Micromonospora rhizosphaerae]SCL16030.1 hypothetical protein GA0070624_0902 [Micromonospora rhizosphaerae]